MPNKWNNTFVKIGLIVKVVNFQCFFSIDFKSTNADSRYTQMSDLSLIPVGISF